MEVNILHYRKQMISKPSEDRRTGDLLQRIEYWGYQKLVHHEKQRNASGSNK
jgi:hypothetical protein